MIQLQKQESSIEWKACEHDRRRCCMRFMAFLSSHPKEKAVADGRQGNKDR